MRISCLLSSVLFILTAVFGCSESHSGQDGAISNNELEYVENNAIPTDTGSVFNGYALWDYALGDLNNDGIEDIILVLRRSGEGIPIFGTGYTRRVLLYTRNNRRYLTLEAVNDSLIIPSGSGKTDPFVKIVINDGYFSLEHFGPGNHGWLSIVTFKYNATKNDWLLHKITDAFGPAIDLNPDGSWHIDEEQCEIEHELPKNEISIKDYNYLER